MTDFDKNMQQQQTDKLTIINNECTIKIKAFMFTSYIFTKNKMLIKVLSLVLLLAISAQCAPETDLHPAGSLHYEYGRHYNYGHHHVPYGHGYAHKYD